MVTLHTFIDIEEDDVLDELSTRYIKSYLERREKKEIEGRIECRDACRSIAEARGVLEESGRLDLSYRLAEIEVDWVLR